MQGCGRVGSPGGLASGLRGCWMASQPWGRRGSEGASVLLPLPAPEAIHIPWPMAPPFQCGTVKLLSAPTVTSPFGSRPSCLSLTRTLSLHWDHPADPETLFILKPFIRAAKPPTIWISSRGCQTHHKWGSKKGNGSLTAQGRSAKQGVSRAGPCRGLRGRACPGPHSAIVCGVYTPVCPHLPLWRTLSLDQGHTHPARPHLTLATSAKTLFPNKATCMGSV